jgi:hypothetical protein
MVDSYPRETVLLPDLSFEQEVRKLSAYLAWARVHLPVARVRRIIDATLPANQTTAITTLNPQRLIFVTCSFQLECRLRQVVLGLVVRALSFRVELSEVC